MCYLIDLIDNKVEILRLDFVWCVSNSDIPQKTCKFCSVKLQILCLKV